MNEAQPKSRLTETFMSMAKMISAGFGSAFEKYGSLGSVFVISGGAERFFGNLEKSEERDDYSGPSPF